MDAGFGILKFENVRGKTVLTRASSRSPLRVLTPQNHGSFAWAYLSNMGGGMVDGDRVDLRLEIGPGAGAALMSQSATKIYRSPKGTSQSIHADVGEGSVLVSLPDPVICFQESRFHQRQTYLLDPGASLLVLDAFTSGRHCAGERWEFDQYRSDVSVSRAGQLLFLDSILLDPTHGNLAKRIGRFNSFATLLMIGPAFTRGVSEALELVRNEPLRRRDRIVVSSSPLASDGVVLRIAGESTEELMDSISRALSFLPELLGDNPWTRKW